jgi:hypothetical protein
MKGDEIYISWFLFPEGVVQPEAILKDLHHYIWNNRYIWIPMYCIYAVHKESSNKQ